jgi:hypothetical protein
MPLPRGLLPALSQQSHRHRSLRAARASATPAHQTLPVLGRPPCRRIGETSLVAVVVPLMKMEMGMMSTVAESHGRWRPTKEGLALDPSSASQPASASSCVLVTPLANPLLFTHTHTLTLTHSHSPAITFTHAHTHAHTHTQSLFFPSSLFLPLSLASINCSHRMMREFIRLDRQATVNNS